MRGLAVRENSRASPLYRVMGLVDCCARSTALFTLGELLLRRSTGLFTLGELLLRRSTGLFTLGELLLRPLNSTFHLRKTAVAPARQVLSPPENCCCARSTGTFTSGKLLSGPLDSPLTLAFAFAHSNGDDVRKIKQFNSLLIKCLSE